MKVDRTCLSVIVPIYNEQENLPELQRRLTALFNAQHFQACEAVLVSDGSQDASERMIREMAAADARFKGVFLARNFGHQAAVSVGLRHARGSVVAVIDGDLQDPPEVLPELIDTLTNGADVAYGIRRNRKEGPWMKLAYWLFYRGLRRVASIDIPADAGDFCCMRGQVVQAINQLPESHRFVRGLRSWVGFEQVGVEYERSSRHAGRPKYNFRRLGRLAYDGLFSFSDLPVKVMQLLGFVVALLAIGIGGVYLVLSMFTTAPPGFPTLVISIWFIGGIQMFFLGLLGEYVHRTFEQSLRRPTAVIREVVETPAREPAAAASEH